MACADHRNNETEKTAKYPAHSRASAEEKRPPRNSSSTSGAARTTMPEAASSPKAATRETDSATPDANSKRRFCDHMLAKNGSVAAPAACANMAMGAVKSCLA